MAGSGGVTSVENLQAVAFPRAHEETRAGATRTYGSFQWSETSALANAEQDGGIHMNLGARTMWHPAPAVVTPYFLLSLPKSPPRPGIPTPDPLPTWQFWGDVGYFCFGRLRRKFIGGVRVG